MPHFHFVEIGTSDSNTFIQRTRDPATRGLSVEPLQEYLDRLPSPAGVTKVCAAVGDAPGELPIYYIPDATRQAHNLPPWMKGTNRVGEPHPTVVRYLTRKGLPLTLIQEKTVPIIPLLDLFAQHAVESLDYLKIDTEGYDVRILTPLVACLEAGGGVKPKTIRFETNRLCDKDAVRALNARLEALGYSIRQTQTDTYATL
jgi:FkbM family methyltransferase